MKVLLVGGGGREHALAWKIAQSPLVERLLAAPGNPGIARQAECVAVKADDVDGLVRLAVAENVDLTVVGPEIPLVAGLADRLADKGRAVFGPSARAAALEGSKAFGKDVMVRHGVPTARFGTFDDATAARRWCRELGVPLVVKADGLAAGKGAIVCATLAEADDAIAACMERREFGAAGARVVIEEFLPGEEASFFALVAGEDAVPLGAAQDYKTVWEGDRGPNTGGMGAFAPVTSVDAHMGARIMREIVRPTVSALAREGAPYRGVLYCGLMLTGDGPKVIEFNCRFGDPECQVLMTRMDGDLVPALDDVARGKAPAPPGTSGAAACVNLVSGGYPGPYATGLPIAGLAEAEARPDVHVFHAGTTVKDGRLVTAGGRVLSVTASAADVATAVATAYEATARIRFDGMHYRKDIGRRPRRA